MSTPLSYRDITNIISLFNNQKWPIDQAHKSSLYNRFINTYTKLDNEERTLFLKLSSMYKWVNLSEYQGLIVTLLENIVKKHCSAHTQDVWVYPIKKKEHTNTIKSSDLVSYLSSSVQVQYSDTLYKKKIHVLSSIDQVESKRAKFLKSPLLILDDYIGSGKYTSEVIEELNALSISASTIVIGSLFISSGGLKKLQPICPNIEYLESIESVSSNLSNSEMQTLKSIENKLSITENYKLGYGGTASLITLIRTPNNSLPVFWFETGRSHSAPFPR